MLIIHFKTRFSARVLFFCQHITQDGIYLVDILNGICGSDFLRNILVPGSRQMGVDMEEPILPPDED